MFYADYHVHTRLSMDGTIPASEMVKAALDAGLNEIALTDHCDLNLMKQFPYSSEECYGEYAAAKSKGIKVLIGVEIGQQTEFPELSKKILSFPEYDFVIGSYHCMAGYPDFCEIVYKDYDVRELYSVYFKGLLEYAKEADFDVLGHITYPFRYGFRQGYDITIDDYPDETDAVLKAIIGRGKGIEANASGLREKRSETMPPLHIVKRYRELGGEIITVGSDAHVPEHVGKGVKETTDALRELGFRYITAFEKRAPRQIKL